MCRMIRVPIVAGLLALVALSLAPAAAADLADERALAEKYAPVVRIVEQEDVCGYGEPFIPTDIDLLLDDQTVALRGPWNVTDLVEIGPSTDDLVDRFEYHLDFPGSALNPGCDYNRWAQRLTEGSEPVVYAHVVGEAGFPGKLALQYWFFYPFNDFNNTHEGDWEMIQLVFDAPDARALRSDSARTRARSAPSGATRSSSSWTSAPSCIRRPAPTPTSTRRRSGSVARPRRAWAVTTRVARTASCRRAS
jgi:hypothetical protein